MPKPLDVPEDVLAELDLEERRRQAPPNPPMPESVPEEVRSELDRETRLAGEQQRLQLAEGMPPSEEDDPAKERSFDRKPD